MEFFAIFMIVCVILGVLAGWQLNNMRRAAVTRWAKDPDAKSEVTSQSLYATMESALNTIDESMKQLNPPHPADCECAYCMIAHGPVASRKYEMKSGIRIPKLRQQEPVADPDNNTVYHPEFIRAIMGKNKALAGEVRDLRKELERRDKANANGYPMLPKAQPGETYQTDLPDGATAYVTGPKVEDLQSQRPMVADQTSMLPTFLDS